MNCDAVDAGEVNAGQTVTVLYELTVLPGEGPLATVRVRYLDPETGAADEVQAEVDSAIVRSGFEQAPPRFQLAVLAARFAEHLRKSRWIGSAESLQGLVRLAEALPPETARMPEAEDLVGLVRDAERLSRKD